MKIAVIGAGFTGLTVAFELSKRGYQVFVYEKERFSGGLASGIREAVEDYPSSWDWDLERFYHHWFTNDDAVWKLVKEVGMQDKLVVARPITAIWYQDHSWQLDSPSSLLSFFPLPIFSRLRMGAALTYLKYGVKLSGVSWMERRRASVWLKKVMGEQAYEMVWAPLLKGKFGEYFQEINLAWFWARIYKRTPRLAYLEGGFGKLVEVLVEKIRVRGGTIKYGQRVERVDRVGQQIWLRLSRGIKDGPFNKLIVTTPPGDLLKLIPDLPAEYRDKLVRVKALGALVLVLILDQPLLSRVYWLNISERNWPFLAVVEHTNFMDPAHYGGKHVIYVGSYLTGDDSRMRSDKKELARMFAPYLKRINPSLTTEQIVASARWLFKESFAQPVVGLGYSEQVLPLETPVPDVYLTSMAQVYPWDRGTNYAVELGQKVTTLVNDG